MSDTPAPRPRDTGPTGTTTRLLVAITAVMAALFVGSVGLVAWLATYEDQGDVQEGSFLRVRLTHPLREAPVQGGLFLDPEDIPPTTTEIAEAIRASAGDDRIRGMYISFDGASGGWGGLQELRSAVDAFTASGKPCVAYAETWDNGTYYVASGCDAVLLAPAGITMVNGIAATVTYYAGALEKLGVEADFEHVGDFKSAVEPFERTGPSDAASEAMEYLLDGLYDNMVAGIAAGRGMAEGDVRALIDRPPMSPREAVERGLVDGLAFPDAVLVRAPDYAEEGWLDTLAEPLEADAVKEVRDRYTPLGEYLKGVRASHDDVDRRIAVIYASGQIMSGDGGDDLFGPPALTDRSFRKWMKEAREDEDVVAVVVRVNSPGGSGLASDMMWNEVQRTRAAGKPVVVSMANYAASGGYYISAPADWIVAQPSTITGSIGVFGGKLALGGMFEKIGVTEHTYKRGAEADLFSMSAPFSEQGRATYRRFLSDFYDTFLQRVAEGRGMERDAVHAVAQGRVWTGAQALERGLVDELGGLDAALAKAAELAGVDEYGLVLLPRQKDFFELLLEDLDKNRDKPLIEVRLPGVDTRVLDDVVAVQRALEGGVAALLPWRVVIE